MPVIGRDAELTTILRFIAEGTGPRGLTLEGEAGMGKTTLWRAALEAASSQRLAVLSANPTESDQALPFGVLGDLFRSTPASAWASLPVPQRQALQVALLQVEPGPTPAEPHAIGLAVLSLLQELTRSRAHLIAIDDFQWVDSPSSRALRFALRRLTAEPLGVLLSSRLASGGPPSLDLLDAVQTQTIHLGPFSIDSMEEILASQLAAAFSRSTLRQLHEASGGNPLFALEIGRSLLMLDGVRRSTDPLPIPDDLKDVVRGRLRHLPRATMDVLLVAAAVSQPTETFLGTVVGDEPTIGTKLGFALDFQLIRFEGERIRFTHPLIASAIYSDATPAQRQRLHRRIADVVRDPDERAYHLALGTEGIDEAIAGLLEQAGRRANARGAPEVAANLLEKAARITPSEAPEKRDARFILAVDYHLRAGETPRARVLLEERLTSLPPGPPRARVLQRLAKVRFAEEGVGPAEQMLETALLETADDSPLRAALERDLTLTLTQNGRLHTAATHAAEASRLAERLKDEGLLSDAYGHEAAAAFLLHGRCPPDIMKRLILLSDRAPRGSDDDHPAFLDPAFMRGSLLKWSDDFDEARRLLSQVLEWMTRRHDDSSLTPILFHLGELEVWAGNVRLATAYARQGAAVVRQSALHARQHMVLTLEAQINSHLGQLEAARGAAEEALAQARRTGDVQFEMRNLRTLGFIDLSTNNLGTAQAWVDRLEAIFGGGPYGAPGLVRFHADAVEVKLGLGDVSGAERLTAWLEERAETLEQPWPRAMAARCRGLLKLAAGDIDGGLAVLVDALQIHDTLPQPFERGRTMLIRGVALRRAKQKRASRDTFEAAKRIFEDLGARMWADRAAAEIERVGKRSPDPALLTPTETRVAELVAAGQTNREIASRLYLSVKTVEASLSRIYQKVGVRSRTALAARLAAGHKL